MFIFRHVTLPVVTCLLLAVTVPYVIAAGVVPLIGKYESNFRIQRQDSELEVNFLVHLQSFASKIFFPLAN